MPSLKLTSWNVEHLDKLVDGHLSADKLKRRASIVQEIEDLSPDILCILEGPKGEARMESVVQQLFANNYSLVKAPDGEYATLGTQWIWFLVKPALAADASLLPVDVYDALAGQKWTVHYWGNHTDEQHKHYRHPQVLVLEISGQRVEFIGLHLKSKFVNMGQSMWNAGGAQREQFVVEAIKARLKLATEATNVRNYIDAKFGQVAEPAIFVLGDLNDGPGKEHFENEYLFFDLVSNIQGDVFFARRFLNHALFDAPGDLRWSVNFTDFVDPTRDPHILLDHILFTQPVVDGNLPIVVNAHAGMVEHEVHELINATLTSNQKTSDHRPVSVTIDLQ